MDSRLKTSGMTEREAGGPVGGKTRGFPIKDVGNDRGESGRPCWGKGLDSRLKMSGMTEGRLPTSGMTEGAIDNVGHDGGRKIDNVGHDTGRRVGESMFEQEKDDSEEPETGCPEPKLVPLGFFC